MTSNTTILTVFSWFIGLLMIVIGVANLMLVHPVPGIAYILLSIVYLPPANDILRKNAGFSIHFVLKIILAIVIIMFTLGVSDLGDMID